MDKDLKNKLIIGGFVVALVAAAVWVLSSQAQPGKYDALAQCIKDSGSKFYGAFWCPHCQDQKQAFGNSQKNLPYIECSTPDSNGQLQVCKDAKINAYPTWEFPDGSREEGELSISRLAEKTGCSLPE
jgi:thiol-disulfide isomerase/thioredoxin